MSIPTQMSLVGFIVTPPELKTAESGTAYCRIRVGVEQHRREADGSFTRLDPSFHDVVMFEQTARETCQRFRPGDHFIASGYIHEYEVDNPGGSIIKDEFVARQIGHDVNRTRYDVRRHSPAEAALAAVPPTPAVGL